MRLIESHIDYAQERQIKERENAIEYEEKGLMRSTRAQLNGQSTHEKVLNLIIHREMQVKIQCNHHRLRNQKEIWSSFSESVKSLDFPYLPVGV